MKIFSRGTFLLSVALAIILLLVIIAYSIYLFQFGFETSFWIQRLLATLFATASAFLFALYIYLRRIKDERRRIRKFLESYLNYIFTELDFISEPNTAIIKHLNPDIIDDIIISGHVENISLLLVKVQSQIRLYQQFREEAISYLNNPSNDGELHPKMKINLDN